MDRLPITLEIVFFSVLFTTAIGVIVGTLSALFQNSPLDYGMRFLSIFGLSIPNFLLLTCLLVFPAM